MKIDVKDLKLIRANIQMEDRIIVADYVGDCGVKSVSTLFGRGNY